MVLSVKKVSAKEVSSEVSEEVVSEEVVSEEVVSEEVVSEEVAFSDEAFSPYPPEPWDGEGVRNLFTILRGSYAKRGPSLVSRATGEKVHIGGWDPDSSEEWYMAMDRQCFHCFACGGSLERVLASVRAEVLKCGGSAREYFRRVCESTSEDYYQTRYLGLLPLTDSERSKKAVGRCPRTSPLSKELYHAADLAYGGRYQPEVEAAVEGALERLEWERPLSRGRRLAKRVSPVEAPMPPAAEPRDFSRASARPRLARA